jgi:hypothetical protein
LLFAILASIGVRPATTYDERKAAIRRSTYFLPHADDKNHRPGLQED